MIVVPYAFVLVGAGLLVLDVGDRFRVPEAEVEGYRTIGIAAAAVPGVAPLLGLLTGALDGWSAPVMATAYLLAFGVLALGARNPTRERRSTRIRQFGYGALLALASLPSFALLVFAPIVALAGLALARAADVAD